MPLPPRKRSIYLGKPRVDTTGGAQMRVCKIAESSENFIRRRNAITEMYACIRERR
jgi:hypothetical protein